MNAALPLQRAALSGAGGVRLPSRRPCAQLAARPARRAAVSVQARYSSAPPSGYGGSPNIVERVVAALPYILPFFDVVSYGRYLFYMYPQLKAIITPFLPAMSLYHSLPFGSFIVFFGIYIGIVNNRSVNRFVRFNAVQAILLDILLVLPRLLESVFTPPTSGWGAQVYIHSQSFIWIFTTMWVLYGIVNSFLGTYARIPFVSDAADAQLR